MTPSAANPPTTSPTTPPLSRWKRLGVVAGRLAAVGFTVWLGVFTMETFAEVVHGPEQPAPAPPPNPEPAAAVVSFNHGPGDWRFAGGPAILGGTVCPAAEVAARLESPPEVASATAPVPEALRSLIADMKPRPTADGRFTVYAMDHPQRRLRVITTGSGASEHWVTFRTAAPTGDGVNWAVGEMVAGTAGGGDFPLPPGAARIASRVAPDGRTQAELVSWAGTGDDIRAAVASAGWQVGEAGDEGFSCRKGDRAAWVWVWPGPGPEKTAMIAFGVSAAR